MKKKIVVDTNLLLDDEKVIFKLLKEYEKILIPVTVLKELDKHKYNSNLAFSARNAIRAIKDFQKKHPNKIEFPISDNDVTNNDAIIIETTKKENADLATKDISMSIIANSQGIDTKTYDVVMSNLFEPYNYINIKQIYEYKEQFEWCELYQDNNYAEIIKFFSKVLNKELDKNTWFFIFIQAEKQSPYIYANFPIKQKFIRIDNKSIYREIECDNGKIIKARDVYQICAIYALRESSNVLITGRWGSGKSLLVSAYALENADKRSFITRPPIGINSKYNIGYLPGDMTEKLIDWLAGFTSSLYYIYGNTKCQIDNKNSKNSYDYIKDSIFNQKFEVISLNSIQGLSLLSDDVLLIDEVQLLDIDHMSMILSRPTDNSKLILMGDLGQTYDVVKPSESGLLKLLRILPHRSMAYVRLETSYRSDILELADKLQDRAFF